MFIGHKPKPSLFWWEERGPTFFDMGRAVTGKAEAVGGEEPSDVTMESLVPLLLENHSGDSQEGGALAANGPSQPVCHSLLLTWEED